MVLDWSVRRVGIRLVALAAMLGLTLASPPVAAANDWQPPSTVYVPDTGHTTDGLFLDLWRERSELTGDPVTEELRPRSSFGDEGNAQIVQFYENVAFVYDPDAAPEAAVQLLDLGRLHLARLLGESPAATLQAAARRTACPPAADDCVLAAETGHTVRGPMRAFWEDSGGFDWLGNPLTEAYRAPDGSYLQLFEHGAFRVDRSGEVAPLPLGRIVADLSDLDTAAIKRPDGVPVYDESLFVAPPEPEPVADHSPFALDAYGPGPQQGAWKEIVVSLGQQAMWAYEGDELVISSLVSTGAGVVPEAVTPLGAFQILTKYDVQDMEGDIGGYYFVEDVPDVMYFDNLGNALHGTYWHNNFGTPMSHGCVNLPLDVAGWMYDWAPIGTAVTIIP